ncbi:MAG: DNA-protecting protein DprA [Firmicutes bacterium]|nr:DNA-protecting protein DprA [Bacillota bacterium]
MRKYSIAERACIAISRVEDYAERVKLVTLLHNGKFDKILQESNERELDSLIVNMHDQGIFAITIKSADYPERLMNLNSPPIVLFCRGNAELLKQEAVAIVGTRDCTRYGVDVATKFARTFAERGIVVISGLAAGIDAAAHNGACMVARKVKKEVPNAEEPKDERKGVYTPKLAAKENVVEEINTIAVLGNGVNYCYPKSNQELQDRIARGGLLVSEYLPNTKSNKFFFPHRNRIVAALAKAVVIVEADLKSGTMITKEWAMDLGIDVYAIPGAITSYASRGTNAIIKEAQCCIALGPECVLESFGIYEKIGEEKKIQQISFDEKIVLDILKSDEVHFDEIVMGATLPVKKVTTLLTNMEMSGLIKKLAGNYYCKS